MYNNIVFSCKYVIQVTTHIGGTFLSRADSPYLLWHWEVFTEASGACYFPCRFLIRVPLTFFNWTPHCQCSILNADTHSIDIFPKRKFCSIWRKKKSLMMLHFAKTPHKLETSLLKNWSNVLLSIDFYLFKI